MASSSFAPKKNSPATVIRFFKIILKKAVEDGNLKIPNSFTRKYGDALRNPVYLISPDGTEWKVHWRNHEGGILFDRGWKEFATYFSLDHGHLLVFEYSRETSNLEVRIYDMSGLEIDYPRETVEILNETSPPPCTGEKRRPKSPLSLPSTSKKLRTSTTTSPKPEEGSQSSGETKLEMPSANQDLRGKNNRKKRAPTFPATSEALIEAEKFDSENPSFLIKIKPNHITGTYSPLVSIRFYRAHFKNNKQDVIIRDGKKLWNARLVHYPLRCTAVFSSGFSYFAKSSKLQAGDVCVFELVNKKSPLFDVHIYRG